MEWAWSKVGFGCYGRGKCKSNENSFFNTILSWKRDKEESQRMSLVDISIINDINGLKRK